MESAQGEGRASRIRSMDGGGGDGRAELQVTSSAAGGATDGGDWRALLPPETRWRVVIMLNETLRKHWPISEPLKSLSEIQKDAVQIEEVLYAAATSEPEYMRTVAQKKLSVENQTEIRRQAPVNAQVIQGQNPGGPAPGLLPQCGNPGELSMTSLMSQQAASLSMLGQSMPCFSQTTSTLHDMSSVPRNTMNKGFTQGNNPQDISAAQRKLILQQQRLLMQQKLWQQQKQHMQQHIQQQPLLHPTPVVSTQEPMTLQKFSGLQPGQCTIPNDPTRELNDLSLQQQQQLMGQQSIFQQGSVSSALQQENTLPMAVQSYPHWMSTMHMQQNNRNSPLEPLPRQKQELIRMNQDMQQRQRLLLEMQLQLKAQQQSQKLQQAAPMMQVTHHHSENDVNELKDMYLLVYLLLSMGVLVAMLFMVYNHWWDLWQV